MSQKIHFQDAEKEIQRCQKLSRNKEKAIKILLYNASSEEKRLKAIKGQSLNQCVLGTSYKNTDLKLIKICLYI